MSPAQILVVDDEADIRMLIEEILSEEGYSVQTAGDAAEARDRLASSRPDLVLLDIWMPDTDGITLLSEWSEEPDGRCPVVIMSGHGTVETAVEATRLGAVDYVEKPLSIAKLLRTVENALVSRQPSSKAAVRSLLPAIVAPVGKSPLINDLRDRARQFAAHTAPVLIRGEGGSGREAFAHFIHQNSDRSNGPFLQVVGSMLMADNFPALLLGTASEPGLLDQAEGGVLFIDELQDMAPEAQRLLAAIMAQRQFSPVGTAETKALDARLIASIRPGAAGSDLSRILEAFSVLTLDVPPLRDYPEDVSELLRYYVEQFIDSEGAAFRRFSVAAQNRLRNYPWPGNIRELRQLVQRLLITAGSEDISLPEVEAELAPTIGPDDPLVQQDLLGMPLREAREHFERAYLVKQLTLCGGKVGQLAKRVGMERTHLYRKLRALGIDFRQVGDDS